MWRFLGLRKSTSLVRYIYAFFQFVGRIIIAIHICYINSINSIILGNNTGLQCALYIWNSLFLPSTPHDGRRWGSIFQDNYQLCWNSYFLDNIPLLGRLVIMFCARFQTIPSLSHWSPKHPENADLEADDYQNSHRPTTIDSHSPKKTHQRRHCVSCGKTCHKWTRRRQTFWETQ